MSRQQFIFITWLITSVANLSGQPSVGLDVLPQAEIYIDSFGRFNDEPYDVLSLDSSFFLKDTSSSLRILRETTTYLRFVFPEIQDDTAYLCFYPKLNKVEWIRGNQELISTGGEIRLSERAYKQSGYVIPITEGFNEYMLLRIYHSNTNDFGKFSNPIKFRILNGSQLGEFLEEIKPTRPRGIRIGNLMFLLSGFFILLIVFFQKMYNKQPIYAAYLWYFGTVWSYYFIRKSKFLGLDIYTLTSSQRQVFELVMHGVILLLYLKFLGAFVQVDKSSNAINNRIDKWILSLNKAVLIYVIVVLIGSVVFDREVMQILGYIMMPLLVAGGMRLLYIISRRKDNLSAIVIIGATVLALGYLAILLKNISPRTSFSWLSEIDPGGISFVQWAIVFEFIFFFWAVNYWERIRRNSEKMQHEQLVQQVAAKDAELDKVVRQVSVLRNSDSMRGVLKEIDLGPGRRSVSLEGLLYMHSKQDKFYCYHEGGVINDFSGRLHDLEKEDLLNYDFLVRVHRSKIVNLNKVVEYVPSGDHFVYLGEDRLAVRVKPDYRVVFRERLKDWKSS